MGIFNIFKRKKQASREQLLEENRDSQKLSSDDDSLSYQYNLSDVHKNEDVQPVICEGSMSEGSHKNTDSTETSLEKRMSEPSNDGMYAHKNDEKEYSATDISVASEKRDREFRDAYAEAESKLTEKKNIFESMAGMQLNREPKMISDNVPLENSGLNIAPERFKDFGETPGPDAKDNLKNYGKNPEITPMKFASLKTSDELLSMIRDADAMSLIIKTQAARDGKSIGKEESIQLSQLKSAKTMIVESLRLKQAQEEIGMSHEMLDQLVAQEELENDFYKQEEMDDLHREMMEQDYSQEMEGFIPSAEDCDREPMTDCCGAPFGHPDSDLCSECHEHADVFEEEVSAKIEEISERLKAITGD